MTQSFNQLPSKIFPEKNINKFASRFLMIKIITKKDLKQEPHEVTLTITAKKKMLPNKKDLKIKKRTIDCSSHMTARV